MPVVKVKEAVAKLGRSLKLAAKKPRKRKKLMPNATALIRSGVSSGTTTGASNQIWTIWSASHTGSTATAAITTNELIWTAWSSNTVVVTGGTGITTNASTWGIWNDQYVGPQVQVATPEEQARMVAERQRANDAYHARQMALQAETSAAQARAVRLLRENLDAKQKADLDANGYFELETISKGGERRRYRIHRKWSGNIHQIDQNGKRLKTLCIHPREATPVEDSMLAQKLMLEGGAEEDLLRIANHS